jgi:hypothetical protein
MTVIYFRKVIECEICDLKKNVVVYYWIDASTETSVVIAVRRGSMATLLLEPITAREDAPHFS